MKQRLLLIVQAYILHEQSTVQILTNKSSKVLVEWYISIGIYAGDQPNEVTFVNQPNESEKVSLDQR